jgi:PKD repeat protein
MILRFFLALSFFFTFTQISAQEIRYCGQTEQTQKLFERFPHSVRDAQEAANQLLQEQQTYETIRGGDEEIIYIPVVFHVIHNNGPENISNDQVYDAMSILNRDFKLENEDIDQVWGDFDLLAEDVRIEFRLAQLDPNGNCTSGINRVQSELTYEGDSDMKDLSNWPRNKYLNVWVCNDAGGAAGYSFLPASVNGNFNSSNDGIVIRYDYTGSIGASSVFRSRTLTHEVGHWLNLMHTWGPGNSPGGSDNCENDDNVNDTPETIGWTSCTLDGETCGTADNVQNYMEYSYCSRMFTAGQKARMRSAALSSVAQRNQLSTQSNLTATGVYTDESILCSAEFQSNRKVICVGDQIEFTDMSYNGITEWTWNFGDGTEFSGNDPEEYSNPVHTYSEPGNYTVSLEAGNGIESISETKENYILVLSDGEQGAPFSEGFDGAFPDEKWFIYNELSDIEFAVTTTASSNGTSSLKLANNANDIPYNTDELISTTFDMSSMAEVTISYRWAFANRIDETDDRLFVRISPDCGDNWFLKKMHRGLNDLPSAPSTNFNFTPDADEWKYFQVTVTDSARLTENFRVKFEFEGRGGNNFYLDDINIFGIDTTDLSVVEFSSAAQIMLVPNPTSGITSIHLDVFQTSSLQADLFDLTGRMVQTIYNGQLMTGSHQLGFDVNDVAKGVYMVRLNVNGTWQTKQLIVK